MSSISRLRDSPVAVEEVENWFQCNRWDKKYFETKINQEERIDEMWITTMHGAKILENIFKQFFENRVPFDKIEHGVALTCWIIENTLVELAEIADLVRTAPAKAKTL